MDTFILGLDTITEFSFIVDICNKGALQMKRSCLKTYKSQNLIWQIPLLVSSVFGPCLVEPIPEHTGIGCPYSKVSSPWQQKILPVMVANINKSR